MWRKADVFFGRAEELQGKGVPLVCLPGGAAPPLLTRRELRASWQLGAVQLQAMRRSGKGLH